MLVTTVDKKDKFYQRVILMIMLVFYAVLFSLAAISFLEGFPSSSIEVVENGVHDVLDFDDNASLRTVRQEQIQSNSLLQTL